MKRRILTLFAILFGLVKMLNAQSDTVTILYVNDTHSCLSPLAPRTADLKGSRGGIARLATVLNQERSVEPNLLFLHAGDYSIGDMFYNKYFGAAELQLYTQLGMNAMALGNHEFDLTPAVLMQALPTAFSNGGFPLLSANLNLEADSLRPLKQYIKPYIIQQVGSTKVGIFGLLTPEVNFYSQPFPAYADASIIEITASYVDTLKRQGCSVIICLSHLGVNLDRTVASYVPGIDVIIGGHDHLAMASPVYVFNSSGTSTAIVQADAFFNYVGKMKIVSHTSGNAILSDELIPLDGSIEEDVTINGIVENLMAEIESVYGKLYTQQIGMASDNFEEVARNIDKEGAHDTPLGKLVTDAFREKSKTDIAIELGGSTAQPLYKGPITPIDVFRAIGYGFNEADGTDYQLATFNILGKDLLATLDSTLSLISDEENPPDEMLPQVSGMKYKYDLKRPKGSKVLSIHVGGVPLNPMQSYSVTTNVFLLEAMQKLFATNVNDINLLSNCSEFQAVVDYIIRRGEISPLNEENITTNEDGDAPLLPGCLTLRQNYPNPFNPFTSISFILPERGFVSLKIFDAIGKEITTLFEGELPMGEHNYNWKAERFSSGIYLCRLFFRDKVLARKMILIK